jgi:hypothetical protein
MVTLTKKQMKLVFICGENKMYVIICFPVNSRYQSESLCNLQVTFC